MLRLTEIKLPLDHDAKVATEERALGGHAPGGHSEIKTAILKKLGIADEDLISFNIFRRAVDARKPHAILFIYTIDLEVNNEARLLAKFSKDSHVKIAPDTSYHFVAYAPDSNFSSKEKQGDDEQATQTVQVARQGASEETNTVSPMKCNSKRPVIIGLGPAGLLATLILAQSGFKPLVLERGKAVR